MDEVFPIELNQDKKILNITIGRKTDVFDEAMSEYISIDGIQLGSDKLSDSKINELVEKSGKYDVTILSVTCLNNQTRKEFGVTSGVKKLDGQTRVSS